MSPITQEVLASAQALPTAAQVELIEALIAGLDEVDPEPLDEASIAEIQRRSAEYDTGLVRPVPWSEVGGERCVREGEPTFSGRNPGRHP